MLDFSSSFCLLSVYTGDISFGVLVIKKFPDFMIQHNTLCFVFASEVQLWQPCLLCLYRKNITNQEFKDINYISYFISCIDL